MEDLETLALRSREGDREAFAELVRRLHGTVRGMAAVMGTAGDWIDDVAQEVFLEVYRALPRYDAARPFLPWVRGFARNVIRRLGERAGRDARLRSDAVSAWLRTRQVEEEREEAGPVEALRRCLDRLPEPVRRLVTRRYAEEKSSADIAAELGRSADAVRMSLMRVRDALLACMSGSRA